VPLAGCRDGRRGERLSRVAAGGFALLGIGFGECAVALLGIGFGACAVALLRAGRSSEVPRQVSGQVSAATQAIA
jgi:hypothetical protein